MLAPLAVILMLCPAQRVVVPAILKVGRGFTDNAIELVFVQPLVLVPITDITVLLDRIMFRLFPVKLFDHV